MTAPGAPPPFGPLPGPWRAPLADVLEQPWFSQLRDSVAAERARHRVFPAPDQVFAALEHTAFDDVAILVMGQDPYHGEGQAHGLAFSVPRGVRVPPSLRNIHAELEADLGCPRPSHGNLEAWATRGVLLLNTVLTVRAGEAHSHRGLGWERFTDAIIQALSARPRALVAMLWGAPAGKKAGLLDRARHRVLECAHPSPLSAHRGFFGSRPFTAANEALRELGHAPIDWCRT